MKEKDILIGILAVLIISVVGIVYAFNEGYESFASDMMGGNQMMDEGAYFDMHQDMEKVLESGTYDDLVQLREEYNMPMMYWVNSQEDFELAQQMHEEFEDSAFNGGCPGLG